MDLRSLQKPLKERYRADADAARITLKAAANRETPISCSVEVGQAVHAAQAHAGVGGEGTAACSGDLLLGALAACAQITAQMVAEAMGIPTNDISVSIEGDLDLRGTLGIAKEAPVGFESIKAHFAIEAPEATPEQIEALTAKAEQYCVVMQTLLTPPRVETSWEIS